MKNEYAGRLNILTRVSTGSKVGQTRIPGGGGGGGWSRGQRTRYVCTLTLCSVYDCVYSQWGELNINRKVINH